MPDVTWLQDRNIHPDERTRVRAGIQRAAQSRGICELQCRVTHDETVRLVHLRALPLLDADGAITEWVAVATASPTLTTTPDR